MRIGIFTDAYEPHVSGVTTSINMLKNALESMNHQVYIVSTNLEGNRFKYDEERRLILIPGIKTGIYETKLANVYSRKAMKIIGDWNLDVIHSQTEFSIGTFSRMVAKKYNIPVVHTYHTLYEDYVHYVTHGHFNNLGKKLAISITKYFCEKHCDELIVPTDKIKRLFITKYKINRRINVIPTGIDTHKFVEDDEKKKKLKTLRKKYKLNESDFVIGSVARVAKEKSLDKLIIACKKLIGMNEKFKLMIVGDGPELQELKDLVNKLKIEDNVIFTGRIEYDLIPTFYNLFDIMTSFSTTETQGLTIIEGLSASLPIVCINDKSFREMVQDQYNGFLFEDEHEFIDRVLDLRNDKDLYNTMAINAKNSVYRYSKEVFASDILKVYYKAIEVRNKNKEL